MPKTPRPDRPAPQPADTSPPARRHHRWQALLALLGLGSLPAGAAVLPAKPPTAIDRVHELRTRLQAADLASRPPSLGERPSAAEPPVALWQKWNDWDNWAKWGKQ